MKLTKFSKGIISSSSGSFFWGFLGTVYFQYISFIGVFEIVAHRSFWTCVILLITTSIFKKWKLFKRSIYNKKNVLITGGGGSIGLELCKQILECKPKKIILADISEIALYNPLKTSNGKTQKRHVNMNLVYRHSIENIV